MAMMVVVVVAVAVVVVVVVLVGVGGGDDDGDGKSDEGILDTASAKKQIPRGTHHQQNISKIFLQPWKCTR